MKSLAKYTGVGAKRLEVLKSAGLFTPLDVIKYIPRNYQDRSRIQKAGELKEEGEYQFILTVDLVEYQAQGKRPRLLLNVSDETGSLDILFFQGLSFWKNRFREGQKLAVWGNAKFFYKWQLVHPEIQVLRENEEPDLRIHPIYPLTEAMKSARVEHKFLQKLALEALEDISLEETLPDSIRQAYKIPDEKISYLKIHQPEKLETLDEYIRHLKIRELWPFCVELEKKRAARKNRAWPLKSKGSLAKQLRKNLGFKLTPSQEEAITGLSLELESPHPMLSLLQGDVGSGKTAVYMFAVAHCVEAEYQAAVLLPTEILARQHYENFKNAFKGADVNIELLTGSTPKAKRQEILEQLKQGKLDVLLGTHALYSEDVEYGKLALVVVDEQHRFGVDQRESLENRSHSAAGQDKLPHVMYVSATPIPRTLTQSLYGDFLVHSLKGRPQKDRDIKTRLVPRQKRREMLKFLLSETQKENQLFWVVPRILSREDENGEEGRFEEPEPIPLISLEELEKELRKFSPHWNYGIIHGRLKPEEKNRIMEDFKEGKTKALLATTVIEVGVDVPNANILVIENPERFGLAQLHQLRGRIGRKGGAAWCFLASPEQELPDISRQRLEYLQSIEDGFVLAEKDLEMRGSGSLTGSEQSGFGFLKFTDLLKDSPLILALRKRAESGLSSLGIASK